MSVTPENVQLILEKVRNKFPDWTNFEHPGFMVEEITYKRNTVAKAKELLNREALQEFLDSSNYDEFIKRIHKVAQASNLLFLSMPSTGDLNILSALQLNKESFCHAFFDLLYGSGSSANRLEHYLQYVTQSDLPNKWTFPTYFLFVCFPETEMFIKPDAVMKPFLKLMDSSILLPQKPDPDIYASILDLLQELKDAFAKYSPRDMIDIQSLMWVSVYDKGQLTFNTAASAQEINASTRFWKISPGEKAHLWDGCRENNYIAIGWPKMGDVTNITHAELEERRSAIANNPQEHPDAQWYTPDRVAQLWKFAHEIKEGDRIVANQGTSQVLGIGVVTAKCQYHPEADHYLHRIPVQWIDLQPKTVQQGGWRSTLIELTREKFESIAGMVSMASDTLIPKASIPLMHYPLNQILYGPPGTGKTYHTIERAVEIITSEKPENHPQSKLKFDELRKAGRIGFVTFHQSYSYEDFVEGIRPVMDEAATQQAHYEIRDGILKGIALKAIAKSLDSKTPASKADATFEQLWEAFIQRVQDLDEEPYEIEGIKASRYRLTLSPRGHLYGENIQGNAQQPYNASRVNIEKVWRELPENEVPTHNKLFSIIGKGSHTNLIGAVILELRRLKAKWSPAAMPTQSKALSPEQAQAFLSGSQDFELSTTAPRYVLIIDEINRGNISKILGELITLLEDDKRLGAENELRVTLPYSGESFALPSNLYILGTMNTADKSLALVDVALRRRFDFEELAPDFKVCIGLTDEMREVLYELNQRITLRKDREHRIGHAYFVKVETEEQFNQVFRRRIIPLLQEYFYNDWEGLRYVLGDKAKGRFIVALPDSNTVEARNKWQWFFDDEKSTEYSGGCLAMLKANYAINQSDSQVESNDANE